MNKPQKGIRKKNVGCWICRGDFILKKFKYVTKHNIPLILRKHGMYAVVHNRDVKKASATKKPSVNKNQTRGQVGQNSTRPTKYRRRTPKAII
jgi:hypothetical protein